MRIDTMNAIDIRLIDADEVPAVIDYVMRARAILFPQLDAALMPDDLAHFAQVYLATGQGRFLVAWRAGQIVGTVGYLPYDQRFAQLHLPRTGTVEVVRLFVSPTARGAGVASALYAALAAQAGVDRVQRLYLHTHPFLPGAIEFWVKQGFTLMDIEADPIWQTTHMSLELAYPVSS
jgi:GNAT superfamily N-acetyltransferase